MKRVRGIGELLWAVRMRFCLVKLRVKHDMRPTPRGPTDGLRITPTFMADNNTEGQGAGLKDAAARTRRIRAFFARVDLDLVLEAGPRPVLIDNEGGRHQRAVDKTLGSEHDVDACICGCARDG